VSTIRSSSLLGALAFVIPVALAAAAFAMPQSDVPPLEGTEPPPAASAAPSAAASAAPSVRPAEVSVDAKLAALLSQSEEHRKLGDWAAVVRLLREAHALRPDPVLLYNLARACQSLAEAHRAPEDYRCALDGYAGYLAKHPNAPDRDAVRITIDKLQSELARIEKARAPEQPAGQTPPAPAETDGPLAAPWIIGSLGLAAAIGGAVLGAVAQARHEEAVDARIQIDAVSAQDKAESLAIGANVSFGVGGAFAAIGFIWGIMDVATPGPSSDQAHGLVTVRAAF
jgi:hypothetical protein